MEKHFFVNQRKHKVTGTWDNNTHVKATQNEAMHQFHAFMSTYAYGQDATVDYATCEVVASDGFVVKPMEIWQAPEPEPEPEEEEETES